MPANRRATSPSHRQLPYGRSSGLDRQQLARSQLPSGPPLAPQASRMTDISLRDGLYETPRSGMASGPVPVQLHFVSTHHALLNRTRPNHDVMRPTGFERHAARRQNETLERSRVPAPALALVGEEDPPRTLPAPNKHVSTPEQLMMMRTQIAGAITACDNLDMRQRWGLEGISRRFGVSKQTIKDVYTIQRRPFPFPEDAVGAVAPRATGALARRAETVRSAHM